MRNMLILVILLASTILVSGIFILGQYITALLANLI
jgi:hypothetical protein